MDVKNDGDGSASSLQSAKEQWREKRRSLMEKVGDGKRVFPLSKVEIVQEMDRLNSEIKMLEESNHFMAGSIKDIQLRLSQKKGRCQRDLKLSDTNKKKLIRIQTAEQSLLNELEFFETEKLRLEESLNNVAQSLDANISALDSSVKDIGFMKGETGALIEKMSMLEHQIPAKNIDLENLDGIISGTIRALESLYERMRIIETNVKKNYYKNKRN